MTDPKNIPLDKARPGDMVFLKPRLFRELEGGAAWLVGGRCYAPEEIDHIERPARALTVGLAVFKGTDTQVEVVAIVDGWAAWVRKGYKASNGWKPVDDLEPVDD